MSFPYYQEGYLQRLERQRREREEERRNAPRPKSLPERIAKWWESLSPAEQSAAYSMQFFRYQFDATPQQLGVTLFALGWRRRRQWQTGLPHCRVWQKKIEPR